MQTEQFCKSIIQTEVRNSKALANLVMGLCSSPQAKSVVEVSLSPCYHYQHSSINKAINSLYEKHIAESADHTGNRLEVEKEFLSLKKDYFEKPFDKFWLLNTDITPLFRPHSPTLPQRRYVYKPNNQIKGNRPVDIGYELSTVGLSCRRPLYGLSEPSWNPPLSMRLVPYGENKNSFTAKQVNDLLDNKALPIYNSLTVNALDSNYSNPEYISATHHQLDLVNVIRLASNRNVWNQQSQQEVEARRKANQDKRGANIVYGEKFKLNESEKWGAAALTKQSRFCTKLANGKKIIVEVKTWENRMLRSKRGHNMKDKPFDLISIELFDASTGLALFKKKMWLGVWGTRRKELTEEEIYWAYRNRYDIEHFFRFGKQKLLLDKFQTPDEEHLQNWAEVVSLAYWLLFAGKQSAKHQSRKWQEYDKNHKKRIKHNLKVTPSQVQLQMASIILGFEQSPFLPKVQIKGKGRQKGHKQPKRMRFAVLKKQKKPK